VLHLFWEGSKERMAKGIIASKTASDLEPRRWLSVKRNRDCFKDLLSWIARGRKAAREIRSFDFGSAAGPPASGGGTRRGFRRDFYWC
jgi:hypothetical protein